MKKTRVFSGTRPTGELHLGNYLGGLKGYLALQERREFDCIYSVVDLHGITTPYDSKKYQKMVYEVVLDYLAAGLDPKKCHLMIQSQIPEHLELAYLFSTIYPVCRLEDLPTYKEKKAQFPRYVNLGLLYYPILMAADILIYKAKMIPVGKDQLPHIELTREVARRFNRMFAQVFPQPQAHLMPGASVPSLTGEGKMSKTKPKGCIFLTDDLGTIRAKLAKVPTDTGKGKKVPQEGGVAALLKLVELFQGKNKRKEYERQYLSTGIHYASLKAELAEAIFKELGPIQERRHYYEGHPGKVKEILEEGRKYCAKIARQTLLEAKQAMGLVR